MPRNPARPDLVGRLRHSSQQVNDLRLRGRGRTHSKTFIVGGPITTDLVIPRIRIGRDIDDETPEWVRLMGLAADLEEGTATLQWQLNGVDIEAPMSIGAVETTVDLATPIDLVHGDRIRPVVTAAAAAYHLAATIYLVGSPH